MGQKDSAASGYVRIKRHRQTNGWAFSINWFVILKVMKCPSSNYGSQAIYSATN